MALLLSTPMAFGCPKVEVRQGMDMVRVFAAKNTKFIIKQDIDLYGKTVKIGENSTLVFQGGSLANGTVVGSNTKVKADNYEIFKRGYTRFRAYVMNGASETAPPNLLKEYHGWLIIDGTWNNRSCKSNWAGLQNNSNEDVMLAIRNYARLHGSGVKVVFPTFNALGYESINLPGNHDYDFSNSIISYPDNLDIWEDKTITLPKDSKYNPLESNYGLLSMGSRIKVSNLSVDGKSTHRQNEKIRLGVSCIISIGNAQQVSFENVTLSNVLGPGVTAQKGSKDVLFKGCRFYNIGEHILYSHQYQGFCHFEGCTFDTWDSERLSVHRNGMNYLFKCDPPTDQKDASYEELYRFDIAFNDCIFNNPKRVNSQGRTLGGFLTGSFPVVIKINNCKFTGAYPPLNPGGGETISEKSGMNYRMIVRNSEGTPFVYGTKNNYNIVMEFYNCTDIPFRATYAKRYENCKLNLDVYEDNFENVSPAFEKEFSEPLIVKNCVLVDNGNGNIINHPVFHRPVVFEGCTFRTKSTRPKIQEIVSLKAEGVSQVSFDNCDIDLPSYRLVGGDKEVGELVIKKTKIKNIEKKYSTVKVRKMSVAGNTLSEPLKSVLKQ